MRPTKFDWLIYKIFYWRWNPILAQNERLREYFKVHFVSWEVLKGCLDITSNENDAKN
jgi:hypothetical protein